jgi:DNA-directed RNA polymerase specialized sigma24 family protein
MALAARPAGGTLEKGWLCQVPPTLACSHGRPPEMTRRSRSWLGHTSGRFSRHCYRMLGSGADAEDATQDTLERAWRRLGTFEHGRDLYLGWTFWIYMSPWRLLLMKIGRQIQDWTGRGDDMHQTLRYESARATIAALHACTLEGIDAAIRAIDPESGPTDSTSSVSIS